MLPNSTYNAISTSRRSSRSALFMNGFYYHFNHLRFRQSQNITKHSDNIRFNNLRFRQFMLRPIHERVLLSFQQPTIYISAAHVVGSCVSSEIVRCRLLK